MWFDILPQSICSTADNLHKKTNTDIRTTYKQFFVVRQLFHKPDALHFGPLDFMSRAPAAKSDAFNFGN